MGARRKSREIALQALFMADFMDVWEKDVLVSNIEEFDFLKTHFVKQTKVFAIKLIAGVIKHRSTLDTKITISSSKWSVSRMSRIDRSIIRLAAYELYYSKESTPSNVVINEAIEIAKMYGTEDSPMFINGVLDNISNDIEAKGKGGEREEAA